MSKTENDFAPPTELVKVLPDLWKGRKLILICTAVAALVSAVVSLVMPETFESEVGLLLMPPPFKGTGDEITALMPKVLGVPDYEILLHSDGILMQAVAKVKEEAQGPKKDVWPDQDDLDELDELSSMRDRLYVTTEISEKNVTSMKYSPVIRLTARAGTALQAQHLAQAWAEVSQELALTLYSKGKSGMTDFMRKSFEDARTQLTDINRQIRDVEIEWNDELEQTRLAKKHERFLGYEEKLTDNYVKLASTKKELAELEAAFAQQPKFLTLWKSPPMVSLFLGQEMGKKVPAPSAKGDKAEDKQYGYEEEVLNGTYVELESKLIAKRAELAGFEEYNRQMEDALGELESDMQDLRRECAVRIYERKMLDIQMTPLRSAYDAFSLKLQQAKVAESEQDNLADIKIIADAVAPDKKYWPPRTIIVIAATMLGFMASAGFVVAQGFLRRTGALAA